MKAHFHLLALAIVVSIACHSQKDTLGVLSANLNASQLHLERQKSPDKPAPENNPVIAFVNKNMGKKVGQGVCCELVQEAIDADFMKKRFVRKKQKQFGNWLCFQSRKMVSYNKLNPGDVISFNTIPDNGNYIGFNTSRHVGIVYNVLKDSVIVIAEQNSCDGEEVDMIWFQGQKGCPICPDSRVILRTIDLKEFKKEGKEMKILFYRFIPKAIKNKNEKQFNPLLVNSKRRNPDVIHKNNNHSQLLPEDNQIVLDYAKSKLGQRVGKGISFNLIDSALCQVDANWKKRKSNDYLMMPYGEKIKFKDVLPGDIYYDGGFMAKSEVKIVYKVYSDGSILVLHQNFRARRLKESKVVFTIYDIANVNKRQLKFYRPY